MRHTTFENELNDIRRRAINELKDAIKAHGNKYDFGKEVVYLKCGMKCEWISLAGFSTVFVGNEKMKISQNINAFDVLSIEDIIAITEAIPETDEVKDVSGVYPVPVTWVDTDDIENEGFDTSDVTQEKLNRIAEIMQDYSCSPIHHDIITSDLRAACTKVCLNQKEE